MSGCLDGCCVSHSGANLPYCSQENLHEHPCFVIFLRTESESFSSKHKERKHPVQKCPSSAQ